MWIIDALRRPEGVIVAGALVVGSVLSAIIPEVAIGLFCEATGVAFTVFIVDGMAKRREFERLRPLREMAEHDAFKIYRDCMELIRYGLVSAATQGDIALLSEPSVSLSDPRIGAILDRVNPQFQAKILAQGQGIKYLPWSVYWTSKAVEIGGQIGRFIERYATAVSPALLRAVHELEDVHGIHSATAYSGLLAQVDHMPGGLQSLIEPTERLWRELATHHSTISASPLAEITPKQVANEAIAEVRQAPWRDAQHPWRHPEAHG
jgi:hypothetical protein